MRFLSTALQTCSTDNPEPSGAQVVEDLVDVASPVVLVFTVQASAASLLR